MILLAGGLPELLQETDNCPSKSPLPKLLNFECTDNQVAGRLPNWMGQLKNLVILYSERNSLQGPIPHSFGNLKCLSELRLETNKLSGSLPDSLGLLSELFALNVSSNEMSGVIPYTDHMMTSSASSFIGNPGLCGSPLTVKCLHGDPNYSVTTEADNANGFIDKWSCLSIGMGFATMESPRTIVEAKIHAFRKSNSLLEGMLPYKLLPERSRTTRDTISPIETGICPVNWLPERERKTKFGMD
ncbi:hypothetical protein GH714_029812 [Hevea brasiliensis]|uniref:Leucine-rich repeat-containing N-terminal plant-type domain-containing protein n=1 Tax=Hevea brasiliensis TaxID=3981 RepID=A0A6A6N4R7_HEVBR|nr:hypothetical protein GH714_029812 [Hevea brasiliensis]